MTYEEAYSILECLAIDLPGAIATKENKKIRKYIEAINTAQAVMKDAIIRYKNTNAVSFYEKFPIYGQTLDWSEEK